MMNALKSCILSLLAHIHLTSSVYRAFMQKFNQVLEIQKSKKVMTYIVLFIVRIKCLNLLDCLRIYHDSDIKQRTNQEKIKTSEVKVFLIHEIETCH